MGKRILISGGAGFVGVNLCNFMLKSMPEVEIVIIDDFSFPNPDYDSLLHKNQVTIIKGDVRDKLEACRQIGNVDVIFHFAAISSVERSQKKPNDAFQINVLGTKNILDLAETYNVDQVVFASSREVYGEQTEIPVTESSKTTPKNCYGLTKLIGEKLCLEFSKKTGLTTKILRFSNIYGQGDFNRVIPTFLECSKQGQPLYVFGKSKQLDFIHISDVIDVLVKVVNKNISTEIFNVSSGQSINIFELASFLKSKFVSSSDLIIKPAKTYEIEQYISSNEKIKTFLSWNPRIEFWDEIDRIASKYKLINLV